jgi:CNT family concentrative nucleoside transporter
MNVSGAEAVVAAASPWVGQGESACLVKPYVDIMTPSEIHLVMTSGLFVIFRHRNVNVYKSKVSPLSPDLF